MMLTSITLFTTLVIPIAVLLIALTITFHSSEDREKCSPFECGFDPKSNARIPFSMRFFLLAVIFLVFDIEIVLLMPAPLLLNSFTSGSAPLILLIFFFILIAGLLHEWREGSLDWTL